ncbi:hypothetical protein AvCA_11330 [Azotobacter vinelandii CA]|uniref:Uncharacterized protein n=2 Tax=Azotobacter vinelandii TaxID=354 RepID=C1DPD0_AZOVD|nr:hypothetical protein Avin_11330 [Azotobacter vinelandii DJ]AGK17077.1 hypothetical protein AvCA_11330 [Azotobacter vinelandii CA]AGK19747.1 hypothetical protein AvCA6_11330 [Azotobacter vinelandii CA6]
METGRSIVRRGKSTAWRRAIRHQLPATMHGPVSPVRAIA